MRSDNARSTLSGAPHVVNIDIFVTSVFVPVFDHGIGDVDD